MMAPATRKNTITVEATVTSKGQVTLPKELRKRLGVQRGSVFGSAYPPLVLSKSSLCCTISRISGEWPIRVASPAT